MINLSIDEINALHCRDGIRQEFYRAELIDRYGIKKKDLNILGGTISVDYDSDIQRSLTIKFDDTKDINYLSDRIKPYMGLMVNDKVKWYPLGVFLIIMPSINNGYVDAQCYDETMILSQSQVLTPKLFLKGTNYIEVLRYFLISCGITKINIQSTELSLPNDLIVDDSKSKLEWFNYIATQINYTKLSVDANGWFVSKKYIEPSIANVSYTYEDNCISVMTDNIESTTDFWNVPNVFKRIVSRPDAGELVSVYKNNDPTNPFSISSRGFEIIDTKVVDNIANLNELENLTRKAAFEAAQIYQDVMFYTLNMPIHEVGDVLEIKHKSLNGIFVIKSFSMDLYCGAKMTHRVRRLVNLSD